MVHNESDVSRRLKATFASAGVSGRLHARDIDAESVEVGVAADEPAVLASVFKVLLVLEFARQVVARQIDPRERVRIKRTDRLGGAGTAGCHDDVDMSWRDIAMFSMALSDNTAADVLLRRVGIDTVRTLAGQLGLHSVRLVGGPRDLVTSMFKDVGATDATQFAARFPTLSGGELARLTVLDPDRTTAATPRDVTRLLAAVWRDEAGPAEACAQVRGWMSRQACWHRFAAAFDDNVTVAAKSGTLLNVRNEAGVLGYPDGRRYAVAVFTAGGPCGRRPDVDTAIGQAARLATENLRTPSQPARKDDGPGFRDRTVIDRRKSG